MFSPVCSGCGQPSSPDSEADALGSEVLAVARPAVDLALPLTEGAAVYPLVADVAGEAGLVPSLAGGSHQLRDEDRLAAPGTELGPSPHRLHLHSVGDLLHGWGLDDLWTTFQVRRGVTWHQRLLWRDVGFGFVIHGVRV